MFFVIILIIHFSIKIKRGGELARKLRFFKDQMSKAGFSPKKSAPHVDISLDDLEVYLDIWYLNKNFYYFSEMLCVLTVSMDVCRLNLGNLKQSWLK